MKLQLLPLIVIAILLNAGCKKSNDQAPEKVVLPSQIISDNHIGTTHYIDTIHYKYDDNNYLIEELQSKRKDIYI